MRRNAVLDALGGGPAPPREERPTAVAVEAVAVARLVVRVAADMEADMAALSIRALEAASRAAAAAARDAASTSTTAAAAQSSEREVQKLRFAAVMCVCRWAPAVAARLEARQVATVALARTEKLMVEAKEAAMLIQRRIAADADDAAAAVAAGENNNMR